MSKRLGRYGQVKAIRRAVFEALDPRRLFSLPAGTAVPYGGGETYPAGSPYYPMNPSSGAGTGWYEEQRATGASIAADENGDWDNWDASVMDSYKTRTPDVDCPDVSGASGGAGLGLLESGPDFNEQMDDSWGALAGVPGASDGLAAPRTPYPGPTTVLTSSNPVRYSTGVLKYYSSDLASSAFGETFGLTRSYSNAAYNPGSTAGQRWYVDQLSWLQFGLAGNQIEWHGGASGSRQFRRDADATTADEDWYYGPSQTQDRLYYDKRDGAPGEFVFYASNGNVLRYFDATNPNGPSGALKSIQYAGGGSMEVHYDSISGRVTEMVRRGVATTTTDLVERIAFTYVDSSDYGGKNVGMVEGATLARAFVSTGAAAPDSSSSSWKISQSVTYTYYTGDGSNQYGLEGDLRSAEIRTLNSTSGQLEVTSNKHYRYYTDSTTTGFKHGLKYVLDSDSYDRLAVISNPLTTSDTEIARYADYYFEYGAYTGETGKTEYRVTKEIVQGTSCSCVGSGGLGTYTFSYEDNASYPSSLTTLEARNTWKRKTVETLPDGLKKVAYTNRQGQVILMVLVEQDTSGNIVNTDSMFWKFDVAGNPIAIAGPTAVAEINPFDSLVDPFARDANDSTDYWYIRNTDGQVLSYTWNTDGRLTSTGISAGEPLAAISNVPDLVRSYTYTAVGGLTFSPSNWFVLASVTDYAGAGGTDSRTTTYTFNEWYAEIAQAKRVTVTLPTVSSLHNGSGTANQIVYLLDSLGRIIWAKDQIGKVSYQEFDPVSNQVTKLIVDVNTNDSTLMGSLAWPLSLWSSSWTTTELNSWYSGTSGGLNITTLAEYDDFGRVTKTVAANETVTINVYRDERNEVRTYQGIFNSSGTFVATGAVSVTRQLFAASTELDALGTSVATGLMYYETLATLVTPTLTNGAPDGKEADLSGGTFSEVNIQSFTRSYTDRSGRTVRVDDYFEMPSGGYSSVAYTGTANVNYGSTLYGFDKGGRVNRTVSANGTIRRVVYDKLGNELSTWVGIDDTPDTGYWTPTVGLAGTKMTQLSKSVYDSMGRLAYYYTYEDDTQSATATTVTSFHYDALDRLVAVKTGVAMSGTTPSPGSEGSGVQRPIITYAYDNLGRVLAVRQYDGDGIAPTTNAATFQSTNSSLLRAFSETKYDEMGRIYSSAVYSVGGDGSIGTYPLTTQYWYDQRGQLAKVSAPGGGVTKYKYDGAGRNIVTYFSDGGGDAAAADPYAAALNVTGDNVLEQSEKTYDGAGNVLLSTLRQRHHDETATGDLTTSGTKARSSYTAYFYDGANRLTDVLEVGTNGGSAYTRPSTPPATSTATGLLTHYAYDISDSNYAGLWAVAVTDPKGIVSRSYSDIGGRTIWTIESYNPSSTASDTNRRTNYTYNSAGQVTSMRAYTSATAYQETQYIYGVGSGSLGNGSQIWTNDLLYSIEYPSTSTGLASSSIRELYSYDAEGKTTLFIDRNNTTHYYTYDEVGRILSDRAEVDGAHGVSTSTWKITYSYDSAGRLYQVKSLDTNSNVLNVVTRTYNGFGQILTETQPSGTVTYGYSSPSSTLNASRLTSMTYGGQTYSYVYDTGVDNNISRLSGIEGSKLGSGTTRLEGYKYLGLSTVVARENREIGSFVYTGGTTVYAGLVLFSWNGTTSADSGDKYTGLDRFGRVVDQNWITANGSNQDRFKYTYDFNSNPTSKVNVTAPTRSEAYSYDNLNRLTSFSRGSVAVTGTTYSGISSVTYTQSWNLDTLGNWTSLNTNGTAVSRTHNEQNQLTSISQTGSVALTYDANGNQTGNESGETLVYDAWNRLISVYHGSTLYSAHSYDGLDRRITTTTDTGGGELDTSFGGGNGYVKYNGTNDDRGKSVAIQSDGKIVVAGWEGSNVMVLRYTASGTLDTTFGTGGKVIINLAGSAENAYAVEIQSDGKIVVAGWVNNTTTDTFVLRLNSDGTTDTSFGTSGVVTLDLGGSTKSDQVYDLLIRSTGEILLLSQMYLYNTNAGSFAVTQLESDGTLDTSFGSGGTYYYTGGSDDIANRMALQSDGKLVITGHGNGSYWTTGSDLFAMRLTTSGAPDSTFGTSGISRLAVTGNQIGNGGVAIQSDGKIVIGGTYEISGSAHDFLVVRLTTSGALDTTFSGDGIATVHYTDKNQGSTLQIQSDGRILLAGKTQKGGDSPDAAVIRLLPDGTLDATFGNGDGIHGYSMNFDDFAYDSAVFNGTNLIISGAASDGDLDTYVVSITLGGQQTIQYTYSVGWQVLNETKADGSSWNYVWSPTYIDAMISRDSLSSTGTLTDRIYVRQDANWNVTSIMVKSGSSWITGERYQYSPYGVVTLVQPDYYWSIGYSNYDWKHFHQGLEYDTATGLYYNYARYYDPAQGRFISADPLGYPDGANYYQIYGGSPVGRVDPSGQLWTVLLGAVVGAIVGAAAAYAAGGDEADILTGATAGAVEGALVGAGVPPVVAGAVGGAITGAAGAYAGGGDTGDVIGGAALGGAAGAVMGKAGELGGKLLRKCMNRPLSALFDAHEAGQGFSLVYDKATGTIAGAPSLPNTSVLPPGFVPRNGGHAVVSQQLGKDASQHLGFSAIITKDGQLQLNWLSRQLNGNYPDYLVPSEVRDIIIKALKDQAGYIIR